MNNSIILFLPDNNCKDVIDIISKGAYPYLSKSEVTWINEDIMPHTVTSDKAGIFDSSIISAHQQWKDTFNTIGSYAYHCTLHPWMEGKVAVVVAK